MCSSQADDSGKPAALERQCHVSIGASCSYRSANGSNPLRLPHPVAVQIHLSTGPNIPVTAAGDVSRGGARAVARISKLMQVHKRSSLQPERVAGQQLQLLQRPAGVAPWRTQQVGTAQHHVCSRTALAAHTRPTAGPKGPSLLDGNGGLSFSAACSKCCCGGVTAAAPATIPAWYAASSADRSAGYGAGPICATEAPKAGTSRDMWLAHENSSPQMHGIMRISSWFDQEVLTVLS